MTLATAIPRTLGVSILLVANQPLVLAGLRGMLARNDLIVVGEAATCEDALSQVASAKPDVVILDMQTPGTDAPATIGAILDVQPDTKIIILTSEADSVSARACLKAGAQGYVLKNIQPGALQSAITLALDGGTVIDTKLMLELTEPPVLPAVELTPRQQAVLQLMSRGLTNREIALGLHVSVGTVKNAVQDLLQKLDVNDRTSAAATAVARGLV